MDEEELEEYLRQVSRLEEADYYEFELLEQLRDDEDPYPIVPGCYRVKPAQTDG
jgi:hypothetical protein